MGNGNGSVPLYVGNMDVFTEVGSIRDEILTAGDLLYTAIQQWILVYERTHAEQSLGQRRSAYEGRARIVENVTTAMSNELSAFQDAILSAM